MNTARKDRRAAFERERASKQHISLDALQRGRSTSWYQEWAKRVDRQKYMPMACQKAGKA